MLPNPIPLPEAFVDVDPNLLLDLIADMLDRLIAYNDQIPLTPDSVTRFHSRAPPGISVRDYLRRIVRYASVEKACLLILLIYIDRICIRNARFVVSSLTVHRFTITAITVSTKSFCDSYCTNTHYARVGGITVQELNTLELEFLFLIDWNLACTRDGLQEYYTNLVNQNRSYRRVPMAPGAERGTTPDAGLAYLPSKSVGSFGGMSAAAAGASKAKLATSNFSASSGTEMSTALTHSKSVPVSTSSPSASSGPVAPTPSSISAASSSNASTTSFSPAERSSAAGGGGVVATSTPAAAAAVTNSHSISSSASTFKSSYSSAASNSTSSSSSTSTSSGSAASSNFMEIDVVASDVQKRPNPNAEDSSRRSMARSHRPDEGQHSGDNFVGGSGRISSSQGGEMADYETEYARQQARAAAAVFAEQPAHLQQQQQQQQQQKQQAAAYFSAASGSSNSNHDSHGGPSPSTSANAPTTAAAHVYAHAPLSAPPSSSSSSSSPLSSRSTIRMEESSRDGDGLASASNVAGGVGGAISASSCSSSSSSEMDTSGSGGGNLVGVTTIQVPGLSFPIVTGPTSAAISASYAAHSSSANAAGGGVLNESDSGNSGSYIGSSSSDSGRSTGGNTTPVRGGSKSASLPNTIGILSSAASSPGMLTDHPAIVHFFPPSTPTVHTSNPSSASSNPSVIRLEPCADNSNSLRP